MPTIPVSQLVKGVKPDSDLLVYWVDSRTPGQEPHRVDLQRYNGNGRCDCEHFKFKLEKWLARRAVPAPSLECWHIRQAKRYFTFECLNRILEQREHETQQNKDSAKKGRLDRSVSRPAAAPTPAIGGSSSRTVALGKEPTPYAKSAAEDDWQDANAPF